MIDPSIYILIDAWRKEHLLFSVLPLFIDIPHILKPLQSPVLWAIYRYNYTV